MKNFKTNNTIIRRFKLSDVSQVQENFKNKTNFSDLLKTFEYLDKSKGFEVCKMIVKSCIREFDSKEPIWAVINRKNKKLIGYIRINNYSSKNKRCNIVCAMSEEHWNSQCMKEAFYVILGYCFNKMKIRLVECSHYCRNEKMDNILLDIGMTEEAILRNRRYEPQTNTYSDFIIFSITQSEFYEKNNFGKLVNKVINFKKYASKTDEDENEDTNKKIIKIQNNIKSNCA